MSPFSAAKKMSPIVRRCTCALCACGAVAIAIWLFSTVESARAAEQTEPAPITEQDARAFADSILKAVRTRDLPTWNKLIGWNEILTTSTATPEAAKLPQDRAEYIRSTAKELEQDGGWLPDILKATDGGADYRCTRVVVDAQEPYVQFRLRLAPDGVNFHRYYLVRRPDGSIVADDLWVMLSSERFTQVMRPGWVRGARTRIKPDPKLNEETRQFDEAVKIVKEFKKLREQQKHQEVIDRYYTLSIATRTNKMVMFLRCDSALRISPSEHDAAIADLQKHHPADPWVSNLLFDMYVRQAKYDLAVDALDRMNEIVGGDTYYDAARSNMLIGLGRLQEAREGFHRVLRADPDLPTAYYCGVSLSIADGKFEDTVRCLTRLEELGGIVDPLLKQPALKSFLGSPEYAAWAKTRAEKRQSAGSGSNSQTPK